MNSRHAFAAALLSALTMLAPPAWSGFFSPSWGSTKKLIATRFPDAKQITTAELAAWLADSARPEKPLLIDTRTSAEFTISALANAAHAETVGAAERLLKARAKNSPVVVYCSVGYRSSEIAVQLQKAGYTNVQNLDGSIFQWANEARTVVRDGTTVSKVHPYNSYWGDLLEKKYWSHEP